MRFEKLREDYIKSINPHTNLERTINSLEDLESLGELSIQDGNTVFTPSESLNDINFTIDITIVADKPLTISRCNFANLYIISDKEKRSEQYLELHSCVIKEKFHVKGLELIEFSMNDCVTFQMQYDFCSVKESHISFSDIWTLIIDCDRLQKIYFYSNYIRAFFALNFSKLIEVDFNIDQLDLDIFSKLAKEDIKTKKVVLSKDSNSLLIDTVYFLKKYSDVRKNNILWNELTYIERVWSQDSRRARFVVKLLGGFVRPSRIITYMLLVYLSFSIYYMSNWAMFINNNGFCTQRVTGLNIKDALYFSAVTFTTIGYGDILPLENTRIIVSLEGFLGVVLSSLLVVTFTSRYMRS